MKVRRLAGDVTVGEACGYGGGEWVKSLTIYEGKLKEKREWELTALYLTGRFDVVGERRR